MPAGVCRLCRNHRELKDSHLLPKALYKLLTLMGKAVGSTNANPVVITPKIAIQTSKQVSDYLLCDICEDLLNKCGEKWIIANCWRSADDFPIGAALDNFAPLTIEDGIQVYLGCAAPAIELNQLVHFGVGVFWRAAAHQWSAVAGHSPARLHLGPYEEELRLFIHGDAPFPEDAVLYVSVSSSHAPGANHTVVFPYHRRPRSGCHQYMFCIPGVTFQLMVGKGTPHTVRDGCTLRRHFIYRTDKDFGVEDMVKLTGTAKPKGALTSVK